MDIHEDPKLKQFALLISKLKALLKCPICLNVIQEAVELECHHKLCNTCCLDLSEAKLTCCPICKATIKKRCLSYKDNYSNVVGKFVSIMGLQLESVYKQKVEILAAASHANTFNSTSIGSKCFLKMNNQIETDKPNKENINMKELPARQLKTSEYLKTNLENQNDLVKSQYSSKGEPFDKLLDISKNTIKFNRKSIRNVYTNRKKAGKIKNENKVLDFEDDKNKEAVLNWLSDTRNQFDRLTQTQNMIPLAGEHNMAMNLPSVSQPRLVLTAANMIEKQGRRAKSLDFENKQIVVTPKIYSYNHISDLDDYNIEDPNTEGIVSEEKVMEKAKENVILHLLEDELLDKMDHEMAAPNKITCDNEIKEKKIGVTGTSVASYNSGWSRITEMKETVDKSGKLPKQLRITLLNMDKTNSRKKESVDLGQYKDHSLSGANAKQHNPKHVEGGIPKNILCTNNRITKSCEISANMTNNSQINVKINIIPENESRLLYNACDDFPVNSTLVNEKDKLLKHTCVEKNNRNKSDKSTPSGRHQNISSLNNNQIENTKTTKSSIVDQITFGMTGQNTYHVDVLSNHDDADILKNAPDECITKDVIALHYSDNSANPNNEQDGNLDDYDLPTQTVLGVDDSNRLRQSTNKLLSYINEYIQICSKEVDSNSALKAIDQIKTYVDRLKQINVVNTSVQTSQIPKQDVSVETNFQTCSEAVQTEGVSRNTCSVQTSEISKKDAMSQTYPSKSEKILNNILIKTQKKSEILDTNTTLNKCQESEGKTHDENELLTSSLDNIDFNTLDVVRHSSYKVGSNFDVEMKENDISVSKCDIPEEVVDRSKVSGCQKKNISTNSKDQLLPDGTEVIQKSYLCETHSNRKRSREETEMEKMIIPKKKRNRFIMDALSVEFDNTLGKEATQERESFCEASTEVNEVNNSISPSNAGKAGLCWKSSEKRTSNLDINVMSINPREQNQDFRIQKPTKYLDEYDEIIAKVSENVERLTKQAQVARETNQHPMEKISSPVKNINTSKLEEFKQQFPGYSSDIISGTESIVVSPKEPKIKGSNEDVGLHHSTLYSPLNASHTKKCFDTDKLMEVCHELEDSFDEEFANIHFTAAENNKDKPRIKILANVEIKSQINKGKVGDDDLFSEDEDVETTPQNRYLAMRYARELGASSNNVIKGGDEENSDFPALPPPPAFQDGTLYEVETDGTFKPDDLVHVLSPLDQRNRPLTSDFLCGTNDDSISANPREEKSNKTEVKNLIHSTPKTSKGVPAYTLGVSPIKEYTVSQTNSCVMKNTQKRNILTSTPRQISIWNYVKSSQSPQKIAAVPSNSAAEITAIEVINSSSNHIAQAADNTNIIPKKPCISFTRLSKDQVMCISQMTSKKLATHTMTFDKSVTHMIVSVDKSGCAKDYTVKFMAAIASGIWVLKFDWVQKCLDTNSIVSEEPYEALDDTGGQGPRIARLTRLKEPLLRNFKFFITDPLFSTTRQDIEDIINMLGGVVVSSPDRLKCEPGYVELIITEGRATQDFEIYDRWLEQYKVVTIDIEWLSKSVGRYKQISFRPYIWCSDETLDELNYPDHLVEIVPYSVDQ